jgi:hypothetical protein
MGSAVSKVIGWCVFIVGLVGAAYGIVSLHVEMSVFWLIVASTSGLILLKMRAEAHGRLEAVEPAPRVQAETSQAPAQAAEPAHAGEPMHAGEPTPVQSNSPSPHGLAQAA